MRRPVALGLAVLALAFAAFAWPTLFRYDHDGDKLIRINRVTGKAWQYLPPGLWMAGDGTISGQAHADPNAIDTGAAMAPAPAVMDTGVSPHGDNPFLRIGDSVEKSRRK